MLVVGSLAVGLVFGLLLAFRDESRWIGIWLLVAVAVVCAVIMVGHVRLG